MLKISEIKGRFLQFLEKQNISVYKFSTESGISKSNFSGKSLSSELGGNQISEILTRFPELNPEWLLTGKGEMLRSESPKPASSTPADNDLVLKILAEKDRRIEQLILEKHELEQRLDAVLRVSADIQAVAPPNPLVHR